MKRSLVKMIKLNHGTIIHVNDHINKTGKNILIGKQKKLNIPNKLTYYLKFLSIILVLFYISVASVNYIRANYFYVGQSAEYAYEIFKKKNEKKKEFDEVIEEKY